MDVYVPWNPYTITPSIVVGFESLRKYKLFMKEKKGAEAVQKVACTFAANTHENQM